MRPNRVVYVNGEFVPWSEAKVHIVSHSFSRGTAIFEVMSVHATDDGCVMFRLDEHVRRLFRTAELLEMKLPLSIEAMEQAVLATVKENELATDVSN
jgi:branched-chain amino acid aminotransferase